MIDFSVTQSPQTSVQSLQCDSVYSVSSHSPATQQHHPYRRATHDVLWRLECRRWRRNWRRASLATILASCHRYPLNGGIACCDRCLGSLCSPALCVVLALSPPKKQKLSLMKLGVSFLLLPSSQRVFEGLCRLGAVNEVELQRHLGIECQEVTRRSCT